MDVVDIGIPGLRQIPAGTHLCALYSGSGERDEILFPFLREGLRHGDRCLCYIDDPEPAAVRDRAVGEAAAGGPSTEQFDVRQAAEVYPQSGRIPATHMSSILSDSVGQVAGKGTGLLRATGALPWPGGVAQAGVSDDFFRYEAALNAVVDQKPVIFMCMYDLQRLGLQMLVAVLTTHPVVLLDRAVLDSSQFSRRDLHAEEASSTTMVAPGARARAEAGRRRDPWSSLTACELRVSGFAAQGLTKKDIAKRLSVSPHTVDAHLKHIYSKLDIHSRVQLAVLAMQHRAPVV